MTVTATHTQRERLEQEGDPTDSYNINNSTEGEQEGNLNSATEISKETRCGFLGCYPDWLQVLASKKTFLVAIGLLGMNNAAIGSYFVATITTLEKRFKLPSSSSGIISSAWDVGGLTVTLFIAHYGGRGHKMRWVAYWSIFGAVGMIARLLPHLIYGPGEETYNQGKSETANSSSLGEEPLCSNSYHLEENCSLNNEGTVAYILTVIAQLMIGVGMTAYYSLGSAYLDDNVAKNKFPIIFGLVACLRFIGQPLGYALAAYTLAIYINPDVTPSFGEENPRWLGAWQLGWIPLGILEITFSILLLFFPRTLPREAIRRQNSATEDTEALNNEVDLDFFVTMKRLFKNKLLMYIGLSNVSYMMGLLGHWYFLPKYVETQFRKSPGEASMIAGTVGLVCTAIGIISSGVITSLIKPRATYLAFWNVITVAIDVIGHFLFIYVGCQKEDLQGSIGRDGSWLLNQTCNTECGCDINLPYTPVCSEDGNQMYFSPCHAGCSESSYLNGSRIFNNCSCVGGSGIAIGGPCPIDCDGQFTIFLALLCIMNFMSSTGRAGNTIIQYRSVAPADKSMSIAFLDMFLGSLAFIPGPIFYGFVIDSTCQVWGYTCGESGNCLLYFGDEMRFLFNITAAGFLLIALFFDIAVFRTVGPLKIWEDDEPEPPLEKGKQLDLIKSSTPGGKDVNLEPLLDKLNVSMLDDDENDDEDDFNNKVD